MEVLKTRSQLFPQTNLHTKYQDRRFAHSHTSAVTFWYLLANTDQFFSQSSSVMHIKAKGSIKYSCFQPFQFSGFISKTVEVLQCCTNIILTAPVCLDSRSSSCVCYQAIICIRHSIPLLITIHSVKRFLNAGLLFQQQDAISSWHSGSGVFQICKSKMLLQCKLLNALDHNWWHILTTLGIALNFNEKSIFQWQFTLNCPILKYIF